MKKKILILLIVIILAFGIFLSIEIDKNVTNLVPQEDTRESGENFLKHLSFDKDAFFKSFDHQVVKIKNEKEDYDFDIETFDLDKNKDVFIFIHGLGGNGMTMYPYAQIFLDRGFGAIVYDQSNSGDHPLKKNTMGIKESEDLVSVISYVKEIYPEKKIHIFSGSYGTHTVLMAYEKIKDQVNMLILDSPMAHGEYYLDLGFREGAAESGMPFGFIKALGSFGSLLRNGYSYKDVNALDKISVIDNPVLIFSNEEDSVTPHSDAVDIYNKVEATKEMVLSHSEHTKMYVDEKEAYLEAIDRFLEENKK